MPIVCIKTYEARCDGVKGDSKCDEFEGSQLSPADMLHEVSSVGWLKRGRKLYCPNCRPRYEKRKKG